MRGIPTGGSAKPQARHGEIGEYDQGATVGFWSMAGADVDRQLAADTAVPALGQTRKRARLEPRTSTP